MVIAYNSLSSLLFVEGDLNNAVYAQKAKIILLILPQKETDIIFKQDSDQPGNVRDNQNFCKMFSEFPLRYD